MPMLWFKAVFKTIALPPLGPLLCTLVGLVLWYRRPRIGRALAWCGVIALLLLSTPIVANALVMLLHPPPPLDLSQAAAAQAIVILGGGVRPNAPEYGGDTLGSLTLDRVRYGARLARITGLPVLVSGGRPQHKGAAEAALMQDALDREFGVSVRWVESQSIDTHQNALYSASILRAHGIRRVLLVSHGFDMARASAEFAAAGLEVIPAATHLPSHRPRELLDWVPGLSGLQTSYYALYEIAGNIARVLLPAGP